MIKGIWPFCFLIFIFICNRKSWLENVMLLVILVRFRDTSEICYSRIFRGANNCGQHALKNPYEYMSKNL